MENCEARRFAKIGEYWYLVSFFTGTVSYRPNKRQLENCVLQTEYGGAGFLGPCAKCQKKLMLTPIGKGTPPSFDNENPTGKEKTCKE